MTEVEKKKTGAQALCLRSGGYHGVYEKNRRDDVVSGSGTMRRRTQDPVVQQRGGCGGGLELHDRK